MTIAKAYLVKLNSNIIRVWLHFFCVRYQLTYQQILFPVAHSTTEIRSFLTFPAILLLTHRPHRPDNWTQESLPENTYQTQFEYENQSEEKCFYCNLHGDHSFKNWHTLSEKTLTKVLFFFHYFKQEYKNKSRKIITYKCYCTR